jgi:hypothetical protein
MLLPQRATLNPWNSACAKVYASSITLPISIVMLQIHMYTQLAHGDIEIAWVFLVDPLTHTTVEGRLDIPRLSQVLSSIQPLMAIF